MLYILFFLESDVLAYSAKLPDSNTIGEVVKGADGTGKIQITIRFNHHNCIKEQNPWAYRRSIQLSFDCQPPCASQNCELNWYRSEYTLWVCL